MKIYLLDNFDSFSYNLVEQFRLLGHSVLVYRNDVEPNFLAAKILEDKAILVLSPGPGIPSSAGCMPELLSLLAGSAPILGVCLGHQAIIEHYNGQIGLSGTIVHGKSSPIYHQQSGIFKNLPNPLNVARYHSLVSKRLPDDLIVLATTTDDLVMAVQHKKDAVIGVQFHPESILTPHGATILDNILIYLQGVSYG